MDIIIQSLGFKASEHLENFVREKLEKFEKEARIVRANVTLFQASDENSDRHYCEIRLEVPGNDLFVKKNGDQFEKAIAEAIETIHHSLRKSKEKQLARKQEGSI